MKNISKEELRNNLEISGLSYFMKEINDPPQIWNGRFLYFLKLLLGNKATPEGINLEHLIDFALKKDDKNLINYLEVLPGMKCPLSKKDKIDQSATEIISCMESMFNHCIKEYEEKMKKNSLNLLIC